MNRTYMEQIGNSVNVLVQMPETADKFTQFGFVWISREFLAFAHAQTENRASPTYLLDC